MLKSKICTTCEKEFFFDTDVYALLGHSHEPKRCPECIDKSQNRATHVLDRVVIHSAVVTIASLPAEFEAYQSSKNDMPVWRMTVKGSKFGANWSGRIDVFAYTPRPVHAGDKVRIVHSKVLHRVAKTQWSKNTLEHGTVSGERQIHMRDYDATNPAHMLVEEWRDYVRLEPAIGEEPIGSLVWVTARTKTTLKGLGRQYWAKLSGNPLWHLSVSGSYRSGRADTVAWFAIVNADNVVKHSHTEKGVETLSIFDGS